MRGEVAVRLFTMCSNRLTQGLTQGLTQKLKGKRCDTLVKCDRWAELYWMKQIEVDLTPDEERELEALEGEILWNMAVLFSNPLGKVNTVYKTPIKFSPPFVY